MHCHRRKAVSRFRCEWVYLDHWVCKKPCAKYSWHCTYREGLWVAVHELGRTDNACDWTV